MCQDISKCTNTTCPKRAKCKRYTMESEGLGQSYAEFESENCEYFISNGK